MSVEISEAATRSVRTNADAQSHRQEIQIKPVSTLILHFALYKHIKTVSVSSVTFPPAARIFRACPKQRA